MRLSKITIAGFKSFADTTEFVFDALRRPTALNTFDQGIGVPSGNRNESTVHIIGSCFADKERALGIFWQPVCNLGDIKRGNMLTYIVFLRGRGIEMLPG